MHFSALIIASLLTAAASALPGPAPAPPVITAAPNLDAAAASPSHGTSHSTKSSCTSSVCFAEYLPCYGSLTYVNQCFTTCAPVTYPIPSLTCPPKPKATEKPKFSIVKPMVV
ncbi:hypothetical protein F5Y16DRAFT_343626 [Xylariaceae sp. FL0255]|nr:hypothetical protein F5Y16DRAFT_343626 [Xylariaceae sp. FL0255]